MIGSQPDFEVCEAVDNAADALEVIVRGMPDLAVIDLMLKDSSGLDLIRAARARGHDLPMLVVSGNDTAADVDRALRAGANGYVYKGEDLHRVVEGLRAIRRGGTYLSAEYQERLANGGVAGGDGELGALSRRELGIFELIGEGHGTRRIAELLSLSVSTVETHQRNIRKKLGLRTARDLVRRAALETTQRLE